MPREISQALAYNPALDADHQRPHRQRRRRPFNLDSSKRRSASVRRELAPCTTSMPARLLTAGFGASQPKA